MTTDEQRRERTREYNRRYREANREKIREIKRSYRERNRERINAKNCEYMRTYQRPGTEPAATDEERRERNREYNRRYRAANRDRINAAKRAQYAADIEKSRAFYRDRYASRPDHFRALKRESDARCRGARRARARDRGPSLLERLCADAIYAAANAAVPIGLADDVRDDVIMDIVVAVLDSELSEADIGTRAGQFVRAHFRQREVAKLVSLDAISGKQTIGTALGIY